MLKNTKDESENNTIKIDNLNNNKSMIEFTCKCGMNHSKTKRALNLSGPFCKNCTQRNTAIKKIKNKIALNNELLKKEII
jgi:predicted SprT family Zn-dependent metalloprotease